jgi:hypothetical protein
VRDLSSRQIELEGGRWYGCMDVTKRMVLTETPGGQASDARNDHFKATVGVKISQGGAETCTRGHGIDGKSC